MHVADVETLVEKFQTDVNLKSFRFALSLYSFPQKLTNNNI